MYEADDTLTNLLYAAVMPCFTESPHGSGLLVSRTKKVVERGHG